MGYLIMLLAICIAVLLPIRLKNGVIPRARNALSDIRRIDSPAGYWGMIAIHVAAVTVLLAVGLLLIRK